MYQNIKHLDRMVSCGGESRVAARIAGRNHAGIFSIKVGLDLPLLRIEFYTRQTLMNTRHKSLRSTHKLSDKFFLSSCSVCFSIIIISFSSHVFFASFSIPILFSYMIFNKLVNSCLFFAKLVSQLFKHCQPSALQSVADPARKH